MPSNTSLKPIPVFLFISLFNLLSLFIFLGIITSNNINYELISSLDTKLENFWTSARDAELVRTFIWITLLGKWQVVTTFALTFIFSLCLWQKKYYIAPFLLSVLGGQFFTFTSKLIFQRQRPGDAVYLENYFSFPSGHATIAVSFYGFLLYYFLRNTKNWQRKLAFLTVGSLIIFLLGFSRIYLGVHYFSDVLGGYLSGAIWLTLSIGLSEYLSSGKSKKSTFSKKEKILITTGIIALSVLFYIYFGLNYEAPELTLP